MDIIS